jgi:cell division protein FtsB
MSISTGTFQIIVIILLVLLLIGVVYLIIKFHSLEAEVSNRQVLEMSNLQNKISDLETKISNLQNNMKTLWNMHNLPPEHLDHPPEENGPTEHPPVRTQ